jgi:hypothetical protein
MGIEGTRIIKAHRVRHMIAPLTMLFIVVVSIACSVPQPAAETPKVIEVGASGYEVKREGAKAWATTDSGQPKKLLLLNDNFWHGFEGDKLATTDSNGQAQIKGPNCSAVYIYQKSGLVMSPCPRGGGTGSCSTGTIVSKDCKVSIRTMPADVETVGTWVSVTHLDELQLTLVIVAEGEVKVTPYTQLNYRLVDPEQLIYEVATRVEGDPVAIQASREETPRFLYTASDDRLRELQALGVLPAARTPLGLEELPALREVLAGLDPNLDPWVEQILDEAGRDGFEVEVELPPSIVTLISFIDGKVQPNVAQSWEVSEDGLRWTFSLFQAREMIDGRPYTSEIIEEIFTQNEQGFQWIKGYAGSEIIDDSTIMIVLETPNPNFLQEVSRIELPEQRPIIVE